MQLGTLAKHLYPWSGCISLDLFLCFFPLLLTLGQFVRIMMTTSATCKVRSTSLLLPISLKRRYLSSRLWFLLTRLASAHLKQSWLRLRQQLTARLIWARLLFLEASLFWGLKNGGIFSIHPVRFFDPPRPSFAKEVFFAPPVPPLREGP